jgi:hydrogenase 3 maturation protease
MESALAAQLYAWLSGARRVAVMGVGNVLRGDDGVGSKVARDLSNFNSERLLAVDCGDAPDAFVPEVVSFRPSHVIVVDAADFGGDPGAVRFLSSEDTKDTSGFISTHELPLSLAVGMLRLEGGFDVAMLGIQVGQIVLGSEMSPQVRSSAERLVGTLLDALRSVGILEGGNVN